MLTLFTCNLLAQAAVQPGIFTYFSDSNAAGKAIIYLLIIFSIWAWSIMIGKYMDLKTMADENMATERKLQASKSVIDAVVNFGKTVSGPYAVLLREAVGAWSRYDGGDLGEQNLTLRMGMVENALQRAVSVQTMRYEKKMVMLGSIISGAPFLGLLGTVWGVMDSFGSMSLQASATLQQLAPGVSGALLTTIAGLIVAIPSVFGYNYLLSRSKSMVNDLENFASSLADKIELESRMRDMLKRRTANASQMAPKCNIHNSINSSLRTRKMLCAKAFPKIYRKVCNKIPSKICNRQCLILARNLQSRKRRRKTFLILPPTKIRVPFLQEVLKIKVYGENL